jgi:O-antigen ligase
MTAKKSVSARARKDVRPLAERVSWWALLTAVAAVPLAMSNVTWMGPNALPFTSDQFWLVKLVVLELCVAVSLGAWAVWQFQEGKLVVRHSIVDWIVLAFLGWMSLATITALDRTSAFFGLYLRNEGLVTFLLYGLVYFLALQLCDGPGRVRAISRALLASAAVIAAYALLQRLGADPLRWIQGQRPESARVFSTFGNVDMLGGFLVFPLAVGPALALVEERSWLKVGAWLVTALVAAVWLVTLVRSAWIGGALALVLLAVSAWRIRPAWSRIDLGAAIGAGVVVLGGFVLASMPGAQGLSLPERLRSLGAPGEGSIGSRLLIWRGALAAIGQRPLLGSGPDSFDYAFRPHQSVELLRIHGRQNIADNAHSYPLQLAVAAGVPGALLGVGAFVTALSISAKTAFAGKGGAQRILVAGWWAACAGFMAHLLFAVSIPGSTFLLWIGLSIVLAPSAASVDVGARWRIPVTVAAATVTLLAGYLGIATLAADHAALRAGVAPDAATALAQADSAVSSAPWELEYRFQRASLITQIALTKMQTFQRSGVQGEALAQQAGISGAVEARSDLVARNPWVYKNWVNLALLYNAAAPALGQAGYQQAETAARRAITLSPDGPFAHLQLAQALAGLGKKDEAISEAAKALDVDPAYVQASLFLGDLYRQGGDLANARQVFEDALAHRPAGDASQDYVTVQSALQSLGAAK